MDPATRPTFSCVIYLSDSIAFVVVWVLGDGKEVMQGFGEVRRNDKQAGFVLNKNPRKFVEKTHESFQYPTKISLTIQKSKEKDNRQTTQTNLEFIQS